MNVVESILTSVGRYLPSIVAAVAVLVLGWLVAWLIAGLVRKGVERVGLAEGAQKFLQGVPGHHDVGKWAGRLVFWILMLFVAVAFFSILQLTGPSESLKGLLDKIVTYLPRLLAAALLLAAAWIIGTVLRAVVGKGTVKLDAKLRGGRPPGQPGAPLATKPLADAAFWLVFLLFLPAVLDALAMQGILGPVRDMTGKILAFLPNLFVAALILLVGWFLAGLLRRIAASLLAAAGLDRLSQRAGIERALGPATLSQFVAWIVYVLVLIPVAIAALDALQLGAITQPAGAMLDRILAALPAVFAASLVLAIAYVVGRLASAVVTRLLAGLNFDALPEKLGMGRQEEYAWRPSDIAGFVALAAILLFATVSALDLLGFTELAGLVSELLVLASRILFGLALFGFGAYLAGIAARVIRSRNSPNADTWARVAQGAILVLAGAVALRHMGLANEIIVLAFGLSFGALAVAAAIAFGWGGRDFAHRKIEEWEKSLEEKKGKPGSKRSP